MSGEILQCSKCKSDISSYDAYEYRGAISCEKCFDDVCAARDYERAQIIEEESRKTEVFKGLDLDPSSIIGKANREILSKQLEIAAKESGRMLAYEGRSKKNDR